MTDALRAAATDRPERHSKALVADPNFLVLDVHDDAYGDSPQIPELIGSAMGVPVTDPNLVAFLGATSSATYGVDFAAVLIDADGDGSTDFATGTPSEYFAQDQATLTPIYAVYGSDFVDTGSFAAWLRDSDGYYAVADRTEINLTSARYAFGLKDGVTGDSDFAPDSYTGAPVSLLAPQPPAAQPPAPQPPAPQPPAAQPPAAPSATLRVWATGGASKLRVDVDPNKGSGYWTFQVQRQRADGSWKPLKSYKTLGSKETRTVNMPKGTYRVVVRAKYGHQGTVSTSVNLKR